MTPQFACVILAAGEGKRAGGFKPLWKLGQGTVIDRVIRSATSVCGEIRVVAGSEVEGLRQHLSQAWPDVDLIVNADWETGMFSSVRAGLAGIRKPCFVHPADVPGPDRAVYEALAKAFAERSPVIARPAFQGKPGHPVLLSIEAVKAVFKTPATSTLRDALKPLPRLDVEVFSDLILRDMDTAEAYLALKAELEAKEP